MIYDRLQKIDELDLGFCYQKQVHKNGSVFHNMSIKGKHGDIVYSQADPQLFDLHLAKFLDVQGFVIPKQEPTIEDLI